MKTDQQSTPVAAAEPRAPSISRRTAIATAMAGAALGAPNMVAATAPDPLLPLMARWRALQDRWSTRGSESDEECDWYAATTHDLECEMLEVAPTTAAGALAALDVVAEELRESFECEAYPYTEFQLGLVEGAIAFLRSGAGAAA